MPAGMTVCHDGRVEIHTESWVDEAGSHRFQSVVVHYLTKYTPIQTITEKVFNLRAWLIFLNSYVACY
ncbi:MAG: hypothetical protein KAT53_00430, partial [Dehalococcoidia bacterium]|nr:hypothetical protein [Dehalococcoidia bacterium]